MDSRSLQLRKKILETFSLGGRGHPASALSLVEIMRVLYDDVLRFDASDPNWPLRDRCVLSKGHGCLALYVLLADKGFFPEDELGKFCKAGGMLGGHPEYGRVPGVEASTGSLGHGPSIGVGFALNARIDKLDYRVFVILGDGEINEGTVWEAAMSAGKHALDNMVFIIDYNKMQSYGTVDAVQPLEPLADKWRAFGCAVVEVDGHSVSELQLVLRRLPLQDGKPTAVICHTVKGKGVREMENNLSWHHKSGFDEGVIAAMISRLGDCVA
ncbi:MAG: transketolase [Proteobacteria bacterium]|nr:transketolase [Pseudomonadota bacterium]MBU4296651.1 transketolase [Pseudomonadota bacterium]